MIASEQQAKGFIYDQLDLAPVRARLADQQPQWSVGDLDAAELCYRNFLWVVWNAIEKLKQTKMAAIDKRADEMWHVHIELHDKYAADCQAMFGGELGHYPSVGGVQVTPQDETAAQQVYESLGLQPCMLRGKCVWVGP